MTSPSPSNHPVLSLRWHGRTTVGCVRTNNEDSLCAQGLGRAPGPQSSGPERSLAGTDVGMERPGALLAVADGMGGAKAGEVASGMAVSILADEMVKGAEGGYGEEVDQEALLHELKRAVLLAHERIRDEGASNPSRAGMGTTLTAAWLVDDVALIAHVGDSRAYLFRGGRLQQITKDQSLVEKLLEDKIITPEEAERMGSRNIILQALGSEEDLEVVTQVLELEPGDTMILCTDGLSQPVKNEVLERELQMSGTLAEIADRMVKAAEDNGGPDNITVLLSGIEAAE